MFLRRWDSQLASPDNHLSIGRHKGDFALGHEEALVVKPMPVHRGAVRTRGQFEKHAPDAVIGMRTILEDVYGCRPHLHLFAVLTSLMQD